MIHVVAKRLGCDAFIGISMISRVGCVRQWVADWFSIAANGSLSRIIVVQDALLNNRLKAGSRWGVTPKTEFLNNGLIS